MPFAKCSVGCLVAPGRPRPARPMLSAIMGYMFTCSQHHRLAPPLCSTPSPALALRGGRGRLGVTVTVTVADNESRVTVTQ